MRVYSCPITPAAQTAAQDLFEVLAATGKRIRVAGWHLVQTTELADAAEEILRIETVRGVGAVTSGSGGSSVTPQGTDDNDTAGGATVETNNTTRMVAGSGSLETLEQYGWNVRIPWTHLYTPELMPIIMPGNRWTLSLPAAPADSVTMGGTLWLIED